MSMPNIPDVNPNINLDIEDSAKMLFNSIAMEEMGLSHIINAEGEKLQYILGTLKDEKNTCSPANTCELLKVNKYVDRVLREVLKNQIILQMKLEDTMDLYESSSFDSIDKYQGICKTPDKDQEWSAKGVDIIPVSCKNDDIGLNENNLCRNNVNEDYGISCTMIEF